MLPIPSHQVTPAFKSSHLKTLRPPALWNRYKLSPTCPVWINWPSDSTGLLCTADFWNNLLRSIIWSEQLLLRISSKWSFCLFVCLFGELHLGTEEDMPILDVAMFILSKSITFLDLFIYHYPALRLWPPTQAFLCTAPQVPCPTGADISQHLTNREIPKSSQQRYIGKVPCNHFILNSEEDCLKALSWLRNNSISTEGKDTGSCASFQNCVLFYNESHALSRSRM